MDLETKAYSGQVTWLGSQWGMWGRLTVSQPGHLQSLGFFLISKLHAQSPKALGWEGHCCLPAWPMSGKCINRETCQKFCCQNECFSNPIFHFITMPAISQIVCLASIHTAISSSGCFTALLQALEERNIPGDMLILFCSGILAPFWEQSLLTYLSKVLESSNSSHFSWRTWDIANAPSKRQRFIDSVWSLPQYGVCLISTPPLPHSILSYVNDPQMPLLSSSCFGVCCPFFFFFF